MKKITLVIKGRTEIDIKECEEKYNWSDSELFEWAYEEIYQNMDLGDIDYVEDEDLEILVEEY